MDKMEIIFKIAELILTFLGLVLVIFGWIIPYRQSIKTQNKSKLNEIEFQKYANKKKGMFEWYKSLNKFLEEVDKI